MPEASRTPLRKSQEFDNARDILMESASRIMSERNTIDFSLHDIAEHSGLNSALVKYYFGNKRGLQIALLERDLHMARDNMALMIKSERSAEERMRSHIAGLIRTYGRYPYMNRLVRTLLRDSTEEDVQHITDTFFKPISDFYKTLIDEGVESGEFRPVDPMLFYFSIIGASDGIFSSRFALQHVYGVDEISDELLDQNIQHTTRFIMSGLLARSSLD